MTDNHRLTFHHFVYHLTQAGLLSDFIACRLNQTVLLKKLIANKLLDEITHVGLWAGYNNNFDC